MSLLTKATAEGTGPTRGYRNSTGTDRSPYIADQCCARSEAPLKPNRCSLRPVTPMPVGTARIALHDLGDVISCLGIGRDALVSRDRTFPCVVRSQGQTEIPRITGNQARKLLNSTTDILLRIERILNVEAPGRLGHQLHQAHCALFTDRLGVVPGLSPYKGVDQTRVQSFLAAQSID